MKAALCKEIERVSGRKMLTSQDFDWLAKDLMEHVHTSIGVNTLKRMWGYYAERPFNPHKSTLDVLAMYVGYENFDKFCFSQDPEYMSKQSNFVLSKKLDISELQLDDVKISFSWLPDRKMLVKRVGKYSFQVLEVENSKLSVGDTFECHLIIEGEPLYLGNLRHTNPDGSIMGPVAYVAGKDGGVRFELIE